MADFGTAMLCQLEFIISNSKSLRSGSPLLARLPSMTDNNLNQMETTPDRPVETSNAESVQYSQFRPGLRTYHKLLVLVVLTEVLISLH